MTASEVKASVASGRLRLSGWQRFTHYEPVLWIGFIACIALVFFVYDRLFPGDLAFVRSPSTELLLFTAIPMSVAAALLMRQRRELQLTQLDVHQTHAMISESIAKLAKKKRWEIREATNAYIVIKTHPEFWSGSWGEQITILFDENKVWINSICDPDERPSVVSMGRNRKNVVALVSALSCSKSVDDI